MRADVTEEQLLLLASADTGNTSTGDITYMLASMSGDTDKIQEYLEDLLKAWMVIVLCGFLGGLVFSIVWMTFLRYFAGCMAWVTVISFNVILIALTLYCALKADSSAPTRWASTTAEPRATPRSSATPPRGPSARTRKTRRLSNTSPTLWRPSPASRCSSRCS